MVCVIVEAWKGHHDAWIKQREWQFMINFPRNKLLNTKVPHTGRVNISMKTLTICRLGIKSILSDGVFQPLLRDMQTLGIKDLVNKIITSHRVNYDPRTLLLIHDHVMNYFEASSPTIKNFRHCMIKRLRHTGLRLPKMLIVKCFQISDYERNQLMGVLKRYVGSLPIHDLVKGYYTHCLSIVRTQTKPLGDILFNYQRALNGLTWEALNRDLALLSTGCCCCEKLGQQLPRVQNHVLFRPGDLNQSHYPLTASMVHALQQNMRGVPRLTIRERWPSLRDSLFNFRQQLRSTAGSTMDLNHEAYAVLTDTQVHSMGHEVVFNAKGAMKLLKGCICGPLDKNPSGLWVCCSTFYRKILYDQYLASAGLGGFIHFKTFQQATTPLMESITDFHFVPHCRLSALTSLRQHKEISIPNLYLLIKNKSFPNHPNGVRTRPITSHRKHPFKIMATRYTRGLTVLLKTAVHSLGPTVSPLCLDLLSSQNF